LSSRGMGRAADTGGAGTGGGPVRGGVAGTGVVADIRRAWVMAA
jgi:hypothetical protein